MTRNSLYPLFISGGGEESAGGKGKMGGRPLLFSKKKKKEERVRPVKLGKKKVVQRLKRRGAPKNI